MSQETHALQTLTQVVLDVELAKLRRLAEETRQHQDEIDRLGAALRQRSDDVLGGPALDDLALQTGQDAQWQAWVAGARHRFGLELAQAAVRREAQSRRALLAFGRVEALANVRAVEDDERRMRIARRSHADPGA